jgi:hypothetical protein
MPLGKAPVRRVLSILLLLTLAPVTCVKEGRKPWRSSGGVTFSPLPLSPTRDTGRLLGPLRLERAWTMTSLRSGFGSYSALLALPEGRLLAISDYGRFLAFTPPGRGGTSFVEADFLPKAIDGKLDRDIESATRDPLRGTIWTGREGLDAISRHDPAFFGRLSRRSSFRIEGTVRPAAMRRWSSNGGAEAMVRLADGRFIVLAEDFAGRFGGLLERRRHPAVLFAGDPVGGAQAVPFVFEGAAGFSPTDMAQLPDGRVLILMRRLAWPFPLRFEGRMMIADPAAIRPGGVWRSTVVARLTPPLPTDNFEGLAVVSRGDGRVGLWLISDHNNAATQRTLLLELSVDPAELAGAPRQCVVK